MPEISQQYGEAAARRSLELLEQASAAEAAVTGQFLDSLPPGTRAYQLEHRVKSPESLARKLVDWQDTNDRFPIDDILRYTVLTDTSDDLVATTRRTADSLCERGWQVRHAMHSYSDGSRYKGIHAHFVVSGAPRIEVQIHSVASAQVKDLTTPWYRIERSADATPDERGAARQRCVEASATLRTPQGIDELTTLGGKRVAVTNYSDSRKMVEERAQRNAAQASPHITSLEKNGGIAR
ncbi:hypothetical protein [Kribbella sp. NPDC048915]|uniref:hypothetical protein n=1 Tax=Kribbella sp. NPDC048915 TaxID=3155148 RepID=UPI0034111EAB